jgi:hypothetical protein
MSLRTRLRRLERNTAEGCGCPSCRERRGLTVLVRSRRPAEGNARRLATAGEQS